MAFSRTFGRVGLAWWLRHLTTVVLRWVSERSGMGRYPRVTTAISRMKLRPSRKLERISRRARWVGHEFVEQKARGLCRCLFVGEMLRSGFGPDAKAAEAVGAVRVGKFESRDGEESFARKTGWDGFRGFNEPLRIRVDTQKRSHSLRLASPSGRGGAQKLKKFLARADREAVKRMGDNIRVQVLVEMEADRDAPGTGARGVVVRNVREARRVREANGYGSGRLVCVRSARQFRCLGRRGERARTHQPLGVSRPKTGMDALQLIEGVEQLLGKGRIGQRADRHSLFTGRAHNLG